MKRPIAALSIFAAAVFNLAACAGSDATAPPSTSPSSSTTSSVSLTAEETTPTPSRTQETTAAAMDEDYAEPVLPNGLTETEALKEFTQCMDDAGEGASDETYALCEGALEFELMTEEEVQDTNDLLNSALWQCYLELEETRPELFTSADPKQYSQDPAVIAECGKP